ncbi:MAG TPA: type IX secretion system sortase PorU [Bacteroidota bacterium]|nr:type IX secretion system sortase PorU [Bacteroidota bacterium]
MMNIHNRKYALLCLTITFVCLLQAGDRGVRIIESTGQSLTLEFRPQYSEIQEIAAEHGKFRLLSFRYASMDQDKAGMPDMRFLSLPIALPGVHGTTIDIVNADYETITGYDAAPVPSMISPSEKNPLGKLYIRTGNQAGFYPVSTAAIVNAAESGGWVIGYLKIYPLQYDASSRSLRKCTRMVVRVTYGGADPRRRATGDDSWAASLINYDIGRLWNSRSTSLSRFPVLNSVRSTGQWFSVEVTDDGIYKIDAAYLRAMGVEPGTLSSIRDVKVYGGDGSALSTDVRMPKDIDLTQLAVKYVDKNPNGKFDSDDCVLFFGRGAAGWHYDPSSRQYSHWTNPFSNSTYYLVHISSGPAKEMQTMSVPPAAASVVTSCTGKVCFDDNRYNLLQSGQEWVSPPITAESPSRIIANRLPGYEKGTSVTYRYDLYAKSTSSSRFLIEESNKPIASDAVFGGFVPSDDGNDAEHYTGEVSPDPAITGEQSTVRVTFEGVASDAKGFINWIEIFYTRRLAASSDKIQFSSADAGGMVEYLIPDFSTNDVIGFDITNHSDVKVIDLQLQQQMGVFRFRDALVSGAAKEYWIGAASVCQTPKSFKKLPNTNLHGIQSGAQFVIITSHEFLPAAQRLKTHKERLRGRDTLSTIVIEVDSIYNEFGNGMPDPTAIRNFLLYAYQRWSVAPLYVLLFGDASYDYRGAAGTDRGWVPTYETPESNNKINSYCMDDYFVRLDTTSYSTVSAGIGRLPIRSEDEAEFLVDRIISYETNSAKDPWKNQITIVADDERTDKFNNEYEHTEYAETLARDYTPESFDVKKIYAVEYPVIQESQGRRIPDARQAILDRVNNGILILNYTGHGSYSVWAHESILSLEDVKTQIFNSNRLTFVVAATCDWGQFDATNEQSSAEEIVKNRNGGAIGVLSAVRAVIGPYNASLNNMFYSYALPDKPFISAPRLGDAYRLMKNDGGSGTQVNKDKYHLLCDPTLRLAYPRLSMTIDSINGISISATQKDTLSALQKVTIKGTVRKPDQSVDSEISGTALVTVYDADRVRPVMNLSQVIDCRKPGAVLYKGENSVVKGKFEATFIVPKDISYDKRNGKISVYLSAGNDEMRGYTNRFVVGGSMRTTGDDTEGPSMSVYFDTPSFHTGDLVSDRPKLFISLADASGINSTGTGIGHRIDARIDDSPKTIDLTGYYKSTKDSYQEGTVEYQLQQLEPGTHSIAVSAWDVYNNYSSAEATFVTASGSGLSLLNVFNIPNPVSRMTTFTFQHNQLSPLDVQIKVYSVAGRLIAQIDRFAMTDRFVQIPWDLRDNDGDVLGNGIYFYRIIAKTTDGKYSSEALGKLAVVK